MLKISINSDLPSLKALEFLTTKFDELTKEIASTLIAEIRTRIHVDGKNSAGSSIGEYDEDYLPIRKRIGRGSSTKVILSLTGGLENSYGIIQDENGNYAIAVLEDAYVEIIEGLENRYGEIYNLTEEEKALVTKIINNRIAELLK
jgi:hypothetical protein